MDMRQRKDKKRKEDIRSQMHKKKDIRRKCNIIMSLCRDERKCNVNDISNVRCHGWDMGNDKE